jgi:hypothetical protein
MRVIADQIAPGSPAIRQSHGELIGLVNNVAVRQDEAVGSEDDAGSATVLALNPYDGWAYRLDGMHDSR